MFIWVEQLSGKILFFNIWSACVSLSLSPQIGAARRDWIVGVESWLKAPLLHCWLCATPKPPPNRRAIYRQLSDQVQNWFC